jgi:hypothetical protein
MDTSSRAEADQISTEQRSGDSLLFIERQLSGHCSHSCGCLHPSSFVPWQPSFSRAPLILKAQNPHELLKTCYGATDTSGSQKRVRNYFFRHYFHSRSQAYRF